MKQTILDYYCQHGPYTDPQEYAYLFDDLPESLGDLCTFIKKQLIHPSQIEKFGERLPANAKSEDPTLTSVQRMLPALLERNEAGLVLSREPHERLFVTCRNHALLLASILKQKGVPTRVRAGFAQYISSEPDKFVDHWICEVWDAVEQCWLYVDPDVKRVDIPREEFVLASEAWLGIRQQGWDETKYGCCSWWGTYYVAHNLNHDFSSFLNHETTYWTGPSLFTTHFDTLNEAQLALLDQMAALLQNPDENWMRLRELQQTHSDLQGEFAADWAPEEIKGRKVFY